jgi:hypothetical protein
MLIGECICVSVVYRIVVCTCVLHCMCTFCVRTCGVCDSGWHCVCIVVGTVWIPSDALL